jgi:hypothetical protein
MTPDQINGLDAEQRANIMQLASPRSPNIQTELMDPETAIRRMINFQQMKDENATIWISMDGESIVGTHVFIPLPNYASSSSISSTVAPCL